MTTVEKELVKATVPVLKENGVTLTKYFYNRMLTHNPELNNVFNRANQQNGAQPTALAMSVLAYAEHIDNPSVLSHAVNKIANKHVSLDIRPEQYAIVGKHLLASIGEVLGDAATQELIGAWASAYQQLANIMAGVEANLYSQSATKEGGWSGWRPFIVKQKVKESEEITSFYLYPSDGGAVAIFLPGQYLSVRLFIPELKVFQPRQYSISCAPNGKFYRISVKKEEGNNTRAEGTVSNRLHKFVKEGDIIEVAPPSGDLTIDINDETPVVFISGGVGVTPFMSMIESLVELQSKRPVTWIHGCRSVNVHAFKEAVAGLAEQHGNVKIYTFYDTVDNETNETNYYKGYVDLEKLEDPIIADADYFICGPALFIRKHYEFLTAKGIQKDAIHFEEFGPSILIID